MKNIIFLVLILIFSELKSDDALLRASGGNVYLDQSNSIEMANEKVLIKLFHDSCNVYCKF